MNIIDWIIDRLLDDGNKKKCANCVHREKDYAPENPPYFCRNHCK